MPFCKDASEADWTRTAWMPLTNTFNVHV